ncbi:toxin-antitoxin system YwqK family antitoxin [Arthrobacter sp. R4-81]
MAEEVFKDGKLSGTGDYVDSERRGRWKFYYRNGQLKADVGYSGGQLDGPCIWYREGGGLLQRGLSGTASRTDPGNAGTAPVS